MIEMFGVVGGVEALKWGELGLERGRGERGSIQLHVRDNT